MQQNNDTPHLRPAPPSFDLRELQHSMTEGLPQWHYRLREGLLTLRLCAIVLSCTAILMPLARSMAPQASYRVADGMTYAQTVSLTDHILYG